MSLNMLTPIIAAVTTTVCVQLLMESPQANALEFGSGYTANGEYVPAFCVRQDATGYATSADGSCGRRAISPGYVKFLDHVNRTVCGGHVWFEYILIAERDYRQLYALCNSTGCPQATPMARAQGAAGDFIPFVVLDAQHNRQVSFVKFELHLPQNITECVPGVRRWVINAETTGLLPIRRAVRIVADVDKVVSSGKCPCWKAIGDHLIFRECDPM